MKLFDGSGEYIAAADVKPGQRLRCPDLNVREVLAASREGQNIVIVCVDGFGWELPYMTRVLWKYATGGKSEF